MPRSFSFRSVDAPTPLKRRTGSEKINFLPLSLGGAMLTAYLDAYGAADIHRIVYIVPALQGTRTVSDVFRKDLVPGRFASAVGFLAGGNTAETLNKVFPLLPEGVAEKTADKALDALLRTVLTGSGAMWACLPSEAYGPLAAHRYENGACAVCGAAEHRSTAQRGDENAV